MKKIQKKLREFFQRKIVKRGILIFSSIILFLALLAVVFNLSYRNRILPRTYIGGENLGGKTQIEAETYLNEKIKDKAKNEVVLGYQDNNWTLKKEDINLNYSATYSAEEAYNIGRFGRFSQVVREQIKAVFYGNFLRLSFSYNDGILDQKILELSKNIDIDEEDATVKINDDLTVKQVPEKEGRKVDFIDVKKNILTNFGSFKISNQINLKVSSVMPKIKLADTTNAMANAREILKNEINLKSEKNNYALKPKDFAFWLEFVGVPESNQSSTNSKINLKEADKQKTNPNSGWNLIVEINPDKINQYINGISSDIDQNPQDAKFQVVNGQVTVFAVSKTGYTLDKEKTSKDIASAILNDIKTINLSVKTIQPKITSDSAAALGLKELVGEGKTSWRGSPANRIHNLTLGASKISGTIVKPGEEFSTVGTLGEIDAASGFLPELVIKNGTQVVPEYGGGLCQVSTTLFRAVLNSGLKITERSPHSFRVSYYEPPVGMDATIYDPAPDFKFVNNMSTPILIWGVPGNNSLDFQIYGTKDNRKVEVSDPVVGDYVTPPPAVYTESSTMEPGAIRQVERALAGCTASFNYKVTDASGKELEKETFVSKYIALPNSYFVGPGYQAPPPEE